MAQVLALEWNGVEARLVVASSRTGRTVIEQAFSVGLGPRRPGGEQEVDVGGRIAAALAARGIGRLDTLVAVGRSSVELRQLSLPPAPEEELPELVRFQAMREFNELDENWRLDFVPIEVSAEAPQRVLAAAVGPEVVGRIRQTCEKAGLKPRRLILGPCAAAALFSRSPRGESGQPRLLVELRPNEADLTVIVDQRVVFLRSARLGGDPLEEGQTARGLFSEIRRTMAAAQNQLGGRQVASIVLFGRDEQHAALAEGLHQELATPTQQFDPFAGLELGGELRRGLPDRPGRFAPLLGMAVAELEQTPHAIDFLHPRRPAEPPSRLLKYVGIGLAVVLLVGLFFGYGWLQRKWLSANIKRLVSESGRLDQQVSEAEAAKAAVAEIEKWMATDVVWLDELHELSRDFLPAKDAMLTQLTLTPHRGGGEMILEGRARDHSVIEDLEQALRDEPHRRVEGKDSGADRSIEPYTWQFSSSLYVSSEE